MDRLTNRLWFRLTSLVLIVNAVLLPPLFFSLLEIVARSHAGIFVSEARNYGRILADELEMADALSTPQRTVQLLDSVILRGRGIYAEVVADNHSLRSSLGTSGATAFPGDDVEFGGHGDRTYYLSEPVSRPDGHVILRLGFDETATLEQIKLARNRILIALVVFTVVSVALAIWLAMRIAEPMNRLQKAARRITTGNFDSRLEASSPIYEVQELTRDLESMRHELVSANARLAREIVERASAQAQHRALEQRLRHRERIVTVGTLAGGIAHEFNNIMTPILLYAQAALDDVPGDSAPADDLRRVIVAAHRARSLVNRILTFSRDMETGETVPVRIGPVIEEVLALLSAVVPPNVEIIGQIDTDVPLVLGDAGLVHQLTMNLCTNAIQSMRATGGHMTVSLLKCSESTNERAPPGEYVVLDVTDSGHGMDEETLARIFEPFFTTRDVGEGTGLGLSVAHGIAASMHATIVAESAPGQGTTFRTYFPVPASGGRT